MKDTVELVIFRWKYNYSTISTNKTVRQKSCNCWLTHTLTHTHHFAGCFFRERKSSRARETSKWNKHFLLDKDIPAWLLFARKLHIITKGVQKEKRSGRESRLRLCWLVRWEKMQKIFLWCYLSLCYFSFPPASHDAFGCCWLAKKVHHQWRKNEPDMSFFRVVSAQHFSGFR